MNSNTEQKNLRVAFGLEQQGHIPAIQAILKKWNDSYKEQYPDEWDESSMMFSKDVWNEIGKKIGWEPFTASLYYFEYLNKASTPPVTSVEECPGGSLHNHWITNKGGRCPYCQGTETSQSVEEAAAKLDKYFDKGLLPPKELEDEFHMAIENNEVEEAAREYAENDWKNYYKLFAHDRELAEKEIRKQRNIQWYSKEKVRKLTSRFIDINAVYKMGDILEVKYPNNTTDRIIIAFKPTFETNDMPNRMEICYPYKRLNKDGVTMNKKNVYVGKLWQTTIENPETEIKKIN
jgi:hypothetical protein